MRTEELTNAKENSRLWGILSFLFALATAASVAMIGVTSFTAFNPPGWLRVTTMAPLPAVLVLAAGFGIVALRRSAGRVWAIAGLSLAALSLAAFIIMINVGG